MNYTVEWVPSAEQRLAQLWISAPDRQAVTDAANEIDFRLERDPLNEGESRSGVRRLLFVPPLAVYFDVDDDRHEVWVRVVWRTRSPPP